MILQLSERSVPTEWKPAFSHSGLPAKAFIEELDRRVATFEGWTRLVLPAAIITTAAVITARRDAKPLADFEIRSWVLDSEADNESSEIFKAVEIRLEIRRWDADRTALADCNHT
jgi:hypothetical protein